MVVWNVVAWCAEGTTEILSRNGRAKKREDTGPHRTKRQEGAEVRWGQRHSPEVVLER